MKYRPLILIFVSALILRLLVLSLGYHGDLNNQISWGTLAVERGLNGFYEGTDWPNSAPNQPPVTILLLAAMAGIWNIVHQFSWFLNNSVSFFPSSFIWFWEAKGMIMMMKLPGIVADLGIGWMIYTYFRNKESKIKNAEKRALYIASIWLFNPIVWYNSSVWGQTDSVVNLLGLLSVFSLLKKDLRWSVFWFTVCLLFKGSLSYFAPILFVVALFQKYPARIWIQSILYSLFIVLLSTVWFHPQIDLLLWLYNLYTQVFIPGEIGYLTANAFNFWWLIDSGKTYDSVVYFGIPARLWGFLVPLLVIVWQIFELRKGTTESVVYEKKVFFALAITAFTIFIFMTRIHERYLYPFFPYATLLLGFIPKIWLIYIPLSLIHLLNLYNLFWVPSIPALELLFKNPALSFTLSVLSVVSIVILILFNFKNNSKFKN